jgi:hypothetical protein
MALVNAAQKYLNQYERVGDISVTELIDSPRISNLKRRHEKEIEVDIKDVIWLLHGQLIHLMLEANADENTICEQRIIVPFEGWDIAMKADFICKLPGTNEYCVHDWKDTKVYAWKRAPNHEHTAQNNIYRWGYRRVAGLNCTTGQLDMLLKDFSPLDFRINPREEPEDEVMAVEVPAWDDDKIEAFLANRIRIHKQARSLPDHLLPECTIGERWGDPDRFAVKGVVNGKLADKASPGASKFESRQEAEQWIANVKDKSKKYVVEFRKGENRRCDGNKCWVRKWCVQYNEVLEPAF